MTTRIFVTVFLVLIAGTISAQDASLETCRLVFDRDASGGHYVATVPTELCRSELMSRDVDRLSATHKLGRVVTGSVDLSSSSLDTEAMAQGERVHRWRIVLPEPFDVPPSVSTLFPRIVSSEARGPERIAKCNLQPGGFELVVVEKPAAMLQELQIEWIAYELTPPVTPQSCRQP